MREIFPYERDIPREMLEGLPVGEKAYLVDGKVEGWRGPFREITSPLLFRSAGGLTPRTIGSVPSMDEEAALGVLRQARAAFMDGQGTWPALPLRERVERLELFLSRMEDARGDIVRLLQWEIGKTSRDAGSEFDRSIVYARACCKRFSQTGLSPSEPTAEKEVVGRLARVPRGVVLIMGPFNYPFFETMTALAPALLCGNSVVVKPPRLGCLFFQRLLNPIAEAFPEGSVGIVYGDGRRTMPALMSSGMVDVLYFIGTSPVAAYLSGLHPKPHRLKCILGLEAKNPAIVLPDADLGGAVAECLKGALTFNGQRCAALKILFVHRSVAEEFNGRLKDAVAGLRYGMPWEEDVFMTPLAEHDRVHYLSGLVDDAVGLGAQVINDDGGSSSGTFFYPSLLYPASAAMRVCREEQFGPVVPIVPFDEITGPFKYVRDSQYGQQASIFGKDRVVMRDMARYLVNHVSRVNINCQCQRSPDTVPFTGRKDSAKDSLSISEALNAFSVPAFVATKAAGPDLDLIDEVFSC